MIYCNLKLGCLHALGLNKPCVINKIHVPTPSRSVVWLTLPYTLKVTLGIHKFWIYQYLYYTVSDFNTTIREFVCSNQNDITCHGLVRSWLAVVECGGPVHGCTRAESECNRAGGSDRLIGGQTCLSLRLQNTSVLERDRDIESKACPLVQASIWGMVHLLATMFSYPTWATPQLWIA